MILNNSGFDKVESESSDVKRKMELETNEMRDRLQSEKKAASLAMEEEVEERKRDINQIRQTVSEAVSELHTGLQEVSSTDPDFTCILHTVPTLYTMKNLPFNCRSKTESLKRAQTRSVRLRK